MYRGSGTPTFEEKESTADRDQQNCPECGGHVATQDHESVCQTCGLVVAHDRIDPGPEWQSCAKAYRAAADRTGPPRTAARHDRGLSTRIGYGGSTTTEEQLSERKRRQLARLRREQRRAKVRSKRERNLVYAFTDIRRMVSALGLAASDRDRACELFRAAQHAELLRGRSIEAVSAAAVYAACRVTGTPRTLDDVTPLARVSRSKVATAYGMLNYELQLPAKPRKPAVFLPRLISALGLPERVERRARDVLAQRGEGGGTGANPVGVAGGALLLAAADCEERGRFTQADLAEVAGVSPMTLRKHRDALRAE